MPSIRRILKQKAVYWAPIDSGGGATYDTPIEIKVRWEDRQEQFVTKAGDVATSKSLIYHDSDLVLDGVLWLGSLNQVGDHEDPFANSGAYVIQSINAIPDRKGRIGNGKGVKYVYL